MFPCLTLPHEKEEKERDKRRAPEPSKICTLCPAEPALTSHGRRHRAMGTALPGLGHTQPADTPRVLIYFSALFCILLPLLFCLYYPIQFQKLTHGLGLEFGVCLSPSCISSCAVTQTASSASAPGTACCVHSCKKPFPAWHNPSTPPAQAAAPHQLRASLGPRGGEGNHSRKPGRA